MTKNSTAFFGFLLLMLLSFSSTAQQGSPTLEQEKKSWLSQTKIGISTSGFQSTLSGVRTDLPPSYGFSGFPHTVEDTYGFSVGGLIQTSIFKFLDLEYGLGYFYESERINIDYINRWTGEPGSTRLMIDLHYLEIPIGITGILFKKLNNQIIVSGNLNPRVLLIGDDNYQDIIFEEIGFFKKPYNKIIINGDLSFGFRQKMDNNYLEILAFQSYDFMPMLKKEGWGFYNDLYPARNSQIGIKINYFFKTLN